MFDMHWFISWKQHKAFQFESNVCSQRPQRHLFFAYCVSDVLGESTEIWLEQHAGGPDLSEQGQLGRKGVKIKKKKHCHFQFLGDHARDIQQRSRAVWEGPWTSGCLVCNTETG